MEIQTDYSFYDQPKYKLTMSIATAIFFMLFLLVFQPFGVNNYSTTRIFTLEFIGILSSLMLVTFLILLINEFFLRKWFLKKTTLRNIVGWSCWTFFILGITLFLFYNWLGEWHDLSLSSAVVFILDITTVSIFPIVGTFFYFRYQNLHRAFLQVVTNKKPNEEHKQLIHFEGQGVNDNIMLSLTDFIYGKAQDNYVELVFRENEKITKTLIRIPLSALVEKINSQMIVKCHRSFIVNLYHIRAIADGSEMKLFLNYIEKPIRVSKSFRGQMNVHLKRVKNFN